MVGEEEEFLPCDEPSFRDFVSIHKDDLKSHIKKTQELNKALLKRIK